MIVVVRLIGGLGNQLFQYAAGKSLSHKLRVPLKIDKSDFKRYKLRRYSLLHFNLTSDEASKRELNLFPRRASASRKRKLFSKFFNRGYPTFRQKNLNFDPSLFENKAPIYLDGYWQSEKYFKSIENIIRSEFTFKTKIDPLSKEILEKILNCNSVSIHIRRGDYVNNSVTKAKHGILSMDYYYRSIEIIHEKTSNPYFFIFSDDINWVKSNLIIDGNVTYVSHNDSLSNYQDLRLMSNCKNNIIANSSFSWWGAWLNANRKKIVLAPAKWFNEDYFNENDIVPNSWISI